MAHEFSRQKITAIVPAYNEGPRLAAVLRVLTSYPAFDEVIVVDDGSTDNTSRVARRWPARYLRLAANQGKGRAMDHGVRAARGEVIFFCDADIEGLTHAALDRVIRPVVEQRVDMFIGMHNRPIYLLRFILTFIPLLGGVRALNRDLWHQVPDWYKDHFKIEAALNFYAIHYGRGLAYTVFPELAQTIKEQKYGWLEGLKFRARMLAEIMAARWRLETSAVPPTARSGRIASLNAIGSLGGIIIGTLVIVAAYVGPVSLVFDIFSEKLREDPHTPIINFLLWMASAFSARTIVAFGILVALVNSVVFLIHGRNALAFAQRMLLKRQQH